MVMGTRERFTIETYVELCGLLKNVQILEQMYELGAINVGRI